MAVHIKCGRPYNIEGLKAMIERCGGRGPSPPRCPPMSVGQSPPSFPRNSPQSRCCPSPPNPPSNCCPTASKKIFPLPPAGICMTCPPMLPIPPCPPCPFICPPCTGYPCVTCAPFPKPVPAPCSEPPKPVVRIPMNSGGLFYTGTTICYPCPSPSSRPKCLPFTPIPGMSVSC